MKELIFVFGKIGAGKTTLIHSFEGHGVTAVYIGQVCRKVYGEKAMSKMGNPGAPEETEVFVRNIVTDAIASAADGSRVYIDGMPRKPSQVHWIAEQVQCIPNVAVRFLLVTCDDTVRMDRLMRRDGANDDAVELAQARMKNEDSMLLRVIEELCILQRRIDVVDNTVGTTSKRTDATNEPWSGSIAHDADGRRGRMMLDLYDTDVAEAIEFYDTDVMSMMDSNSVLSDKTIERLGLSMDKLRSAARCNSMDPMSDPVQWTRRFVARAIEELEELLRELPEAWWSKDQADMRKARVELIDAWHFIMSAAMSLGMDGRDFAMAYYQKLRVNMRRQTDGYFKRKKVEGDDAHIASFDK